MLTIAQMQKILFEKDESNRDALIAALPEDEKEKLLAEAEKLEKEGRKIVEKWRGK